MKTLELIHRYQLSHTYLASAIGIPRSTFAKKISPNLQQYRFTEEELLRIQLVITKMAIELLRK